MPNNILHIVPASYFNTQPADQPYLPEAFSKDGFIHCTQQPEVMLNIANRFYKNVEGDVLVLVIDVDRVTSEVKWEAPAHPDGTPAQPGETVLFPHIYGPLNRDAITHLRIAVRDSAGRFLSV
jgi:uncharacterized protein (DUF952 family)